MSNPIAVLISMPWEALELPSIQLGVLGPVLERAGYETEVRSFYLALMDHFCEKTGELPAEQRLTTVDYAGVASAYYRVGMGDWIFAVPPYRELSEERDEEYFAYLRREDIGEEAIGKAVQMRELVPGFLKECVSEIVKMKPAVVGFTTSFSQNVASLVLSKMLKEREPSVRVVFGGANCDGEMGAALHRSFEWVDVVVRGEGEVVLPGVMADLIAGREVRPQPGLCYRSESGESVAVEQKGGEVVRMDEVPAPDYDEYFARLQLSPARVDISPKVTLLFESARGCWWGEKQHCTFCGLNGSAMTFRSKSASRVADELLSLSRKYQRLDFSAVDNIIDMGYIKALLPVLSDQGFDLNLFYETKSNLKKEQLRLMREAGVVHIQPGIESLSNAILKLMRKGVTGMQNVRLLKWASLFDIQVTWNLLYGFPGEPETEYERMADVMKSLTHLQPPQTLIHLALERFSPYQQQPEAFGLKIIGPHPYYRFLYDTNDETLNDLAYTFEYDYQDARKPGTYVKAAREVVKMWQDTQASYPLAGTSLRYRRGPGFLVIHDRRPNLDPSDYSFGETEARIYLACDAGATPQAVWKELRGAGDTELEVEDVKGFLDELLAARLVYEEEGRYLSLALPANKDAGERESIMRSEVETQPNALVQIRGDARFPHRNVA